MHSELNSSNSQNHKAIKTVLSKVVSGKSTAIERVVVDQCLSYAMNPSESKFFFDALFDEIDNHCSHQYAISKLLFILQTITNKKDPQINSLLRMYLPEIQTITMLTFEDKRPPLRKQIHQTAQDIYESLAYGKQLDEGVVNMATQMTFYKPVQDNDSLQAKPEMLSGPQEKQGAAAAGLFWIDNDDDENENEKEKGDVIDAAPDVHAQNEEKEEEELGPDPFDDFVGYDPFEELVVPDNFSTKFLGIPNQTSAPVSNAFF